MFSAARPYFELIRFDRPVGWLLLLWPTLGALWIATGEFPSAHLLIVFGLGVFLTRSAGCIINDYADRWLDPHVERTRLRPLAVGSISGRAALALFATLMAVAFALVLSTNLNTVLWSLPALVLAISYPYTKRFFFAPQMVLGIAFSFGIPMAYVAAGTEFDLVCVLLFLANLCWTFGYDTLYAMVDREDDVLRGARSSAISLGQFDLVGIALAFTLAVGLKLWLGLHAGFNWFYFAGLTVFAAGLICTLVFVRGRARDVCFVAFKHQHWLGFAWFLGVAAALQR
jgi:4-hydroxybenzoate polyprenyltransferase